MSPDSNRPVFTNHWAKEAAVNKVARPLCSCLYRNGRWSELKLHNEQQDTSCSAWLRLLELVDNAAEDKREEFSPGREMTPEQWTQIVTLPPSIARLKSVKHLILYGSSIVRIPSCIGELENLEEFTPYTSHRLHWFPFEITRCTKLSRSTVSTRALYGNHKYRPPFPRLPQFDGSQAPTKCSVCDSPLGESRPMQFWVSLPVGADVLPLLIHACSRQCLSRIPKPPDGYVQTPHNGGLGLTQPGRTY